MVNYRMVGSAYRLYLKLESAYYFLRRSGAAPIDLVRLIRILRAAKRRYIRRINIWQEYLTSL